MPWGKNSKLTPGSTSAKENAQAFACQLKSQSNSDNASMKTFSTSFDNNESFQTKEIY
jgi:hypothetical protein